MQITDLGASLQSSESEAAMWQEAAKEEAATGTAAVQELETVRQQVRDTSLHGEVAWESIMGLKDVNKRCYARAGGGSWCQG